jgi:hypothetical protein
LLASPTLSNFSSYSSYYYYVAAAAAAVSPVKLYIIFDLFVPRNSRFWQRSLFSSLSFSDRVKSQMGNRTDEIWPRMDTDLAKHIKEGKSCF